MADNVYVVDQFAIQSEIQFEDVYHILFSLLQSESSNEGRSLGQKVFEDKTCNFHRFASNLVLRVHSQTQLNIYLNKYRIVICLKLEYESRESSKTGGRR